MSAHPVILPVFLVLEELIQLAKPVTRAIASVVRYVISLAYRAMEYQQPLVSAYYVQVHVQSAIFLTPTVQNASHFLPNIFCLLLDQCLLV